MEVIDIRMTFYLYIFKMKLQLVILIHWNFWTGANCWKRSMFCFYLLLFFFPSKVCIFENTNSITFSKIFFRILIGNKSLQCNKNQVPNKLSGLNMFFFFFNTVSFMTYVNSWLSGTFRTAALCGLHAAT